MKQQAAAQGFAFKIPMMDFDTINARPLEHMEEHIEQVKGRGLHKNAEKMEAVLGNIRKIVDECEKRNIWK